MCKIGKIREEKRIIDKEKKEFIVLLLGSHLICTLIFNFVLLCVFYFFFFSLSLSLLFDKIFYSCTQTHARTHTYMHMCAYMRARSLARRC